MEKRPFCFMVVFWGERYRRYFLEYCLPSLLSPGNIPSLDLERRSKFAMATTRADWAVVQASPIFARLKTFVEPVLIEIEPPPPNFGNVEYMSRAHGRATSMAHVHKAYGCMLSPDLMVSDGTVARLQKYAEDGAQVVLAIALRLNEEDLFAELARAGALDPARRHGEAGAAITLAPRVLAQATVKSLHAEILSCDWESPHFSDFPNSCWWRVPRGDGLVAFNFSWSPFLLDYAAVQAHDAELFETSTIDAVYIARNFPDSTRIHVVADSDEMIEVSWTPRRDGPQIRPKLMTRIPIVGELIKGVLLRAAFIDYVFTVDDYVKKDNFAEPVLIHGGDLSAEYDATAGRGKAIIARFLGDHLPQLYGRADLDADSPSRRRSWWLFLDFLVRFVGFYRWYKRKEQAARIYTIAAVGALRGDKDARARIGRRLNRLMGRPI